MASDEMTSKLLAKKYITSTFLYWLHIIGGIEREFWFTAGRENMRDFYRFEEVANVLKKLIVGLCLGDPGQK